MFDDVRKSTLDTDGNEKPVKLKTKLFYLTTVRLKDSMVFTATSVEADNFTQNPSWFYRCLIDWLILTAQLNVRKKPATKTALK